MSDSVVKGLTRPATECQVQFRAPGATTQVAMAATAGLCDFERERLERIANNQRMIEVRGGA